MKRNTLRRLERSARTPANSAKAYEALRARAHKARPDDDPDEIDTRLRSALGFTRPRYGVA